MEELAMLFLYATALGLPALLLYVLIDIWISGKQVRRMKRTLKRLKRR